MLQSIRFAFRINGKYLFSSLIIVSAIAVLVAIAGVFYASLEQQEASRMPFVEPGRILKLWRAEKTGPADGFSESVFLEFKGQQQSFSHFGGVAFSGKKRMGNAGEPVSLRLFACSAEVMEITGLSPLMGRFFSESDERLQDGRVVLLSEEVWRERFDSSDSIIGQVITLNDEAHTVIGVVPRALTQTRMAMGADVWTALHFDPTEKRQRLVEMFGRLKNGVTRNQAQGEAETLLFRIEKNRGANGNESTATGAFVAGLAEVVRARETNWQELAAIAAMGTLLVCVALIACFNMTSLLFVRTAARVGEINVRISQGASRMRIICQLIGESLVLSVAGGSAGLILSLVLMRLMAINTLEFSFDPGMYSLAFGMAAFLGALVSIWPALRASKTDLMSGMKDLGGLSAGRRRHRARNFLVGGQICMAAVLVSTATLTVRGFVGIWAGELPVDAEKLLTVEVHPDEDEYASGAERSIYAARALDAVRELSGVESVAVTSTDLSANYAILEAVELPGFEGAAQEGWSATVHQISAELPSLMGRKLLVGAHLKSGGPPAYEALVNQTFVKRYLNGVEPLGQSIRCSMVADMDLTIVGVVSDSHVRMSPSRIRPEVFINYRHPLPARASINLLVQASGSTGLLGPLVRQALLDLNPQQPVGRVITFEAILASWMDPMLELTVATVCLSGFGLIMALLGVYGVVAYAAVERTQEMGIRMALGAGREAIGRLIVGEGARLLLIGAVPGVLLAAFLSQGLPKGMFRTVSALDPSNYLLGLVLIGIAGLTASILPAWRVLKLNPMDALRID